MARSLIPAVMLVLALAGCAGGNGSTLVGAQAPAFDDPLVRGGGALSMNQLRGKPLVLDFFATWCPPCNAEAPEVEAAYRKYAPKGLQIVGVDVLEDAAKAKQFVAKHKVTYPAVVDGGTLSDAYQINGMPVAVFIDKTGVVRKIEVGQISPAQLDADINAVLE